MTNTFNLTQAEFWQYSCELYSNANIKRVCLDFQNTHEAEVNLILLLAYAAQHQYRVTESSIVKLHYAAHEFSRKYTQPLRLMRSRLSDDTTIPTSQKDILKQSILNNELVFERQQQSLLLNACLNDHTIQITKTNPLPHTHEETSSLWIYLNNLTKTAFPPNWENDYKVLIAAL